LCPGTQNEKSAPMHAYTFISGKMPIETKAKTPKFLEKRN